MIRRCRRRALYHRAETFSIEDAKALGEELGIDWEEVEFTPDDLKRGMEVELEHGSELGEATNVTHDDPLMTAQIALAHLLEDPEYYDHLAEMEEKFKKEGRFAMRRQRRRRRIGAVQTAEDLLVGEPAIDMLNTLKRYDRELRRAKKELEQNYTNLTVREHTVLSLINSLLRSMRRAKEMLLAAEDFLGR